MPQNLSSKPLEVSLKLRYKSLLSFPSFGLVATIWTMVGRAGWWDLGTCRMLLHHRLRIASAWRTAMLLGKLGMLLR